MASYPDVLKVAQTLGGTKVLREQVSTVADLDRAVGRGLPFAALKYVVRFFPERQKTRVQQIVMPRSTLQRREEEGRLRPAESERLERIALVRSHSHALAQARGWLASNLRHARQEAVSSTAEAARQVGEDPTVAAVGTTAAAARFGLSIIAADIGDHIDTATRFVVLSNRYAAATGADKTSMVVFLGHDRPGLLLQVLNEFAMRSINLTKIESRPTKKQLGEYCIFIDCVGHISEPRVGEAMRGVHRHVAELRILGSYPRAVGYLDMPNSNDSAAAYSEAQDWYARIMQHIDGGTQQ